MSFREKGFPAVSITSLYKNPYHHTAEDTRDKIDRAFLLKAAQAITRLFLTILQN